MQETKIHNKQTPLPKQRSKFLLKPKIKANVAVYLPSEKFKERLKNGQKLMLAGGCRNGTKAIRVNCNERVKLDSYSSDHEEAD